MRSKVGILITLGSSIFSLSIAAPFSEQSAFCQDQIRGKYSSQYELQKAYNQCMRNADARIEEYERELKVRRDILRKFEEDHYRERDKRNKENAAQQKIDNERHRKLSDNPFSVIER